MSTDDLILSYQRMIRSYPILPSAIGARRDGGSFLLPLSAAHAQPRISRLPSGPQCCDRRVACRTHTGAFMAHGMQVSQWAAANILERAWTSIPRSTVCVGPILCRRLPVSAVSAWRGRCIRGHALLCAHACEQAAARLGYVRACVPSGCGRRARLRGAECAREAELR